MLGRVVDCDPYREGVSSRFKVGPACGFRTAVESQMSFLSEMGHWLVNRTGSQVETQFAWLRNLLTLNWQSLLITHNAAAW